MKREANEKEKTKPLYPFFYFFYFFYFFETSFQKQSAGLDSSLAVSTSHPPSVTTIVCSNCADFSPSLVTEVHPSGHVASLHPPALIIGSIVKICPAFIMPTALFPA